MTDKELTTEQKVRLILDKTYIDGVKNGKGGLGYSERAFDKVMELLVDERQKLLSEVEGWLVDEETVWKSDGVYNDDAEYHKKIGRNSIRAELRAKVQEMREGNE